VLVVEASLPRRCAAVAFLVTALAYVVLLIAYSAWLKHIVIVDDDRRRRRGSCSARSPGRSSSTSRYRAGS
jgi:hypothetical protein